jgi:hypothetical protein
VFLGPGLTIEALRPAGRRSPTDCKPATDTATRRAQRPRESSPGSAGAGPRQRSENSKNRADVGLFWGADPRALIRASSNGSWTRQARIAGGPRIAKRS